METQKDSKMILEPQHLDHEKTFIVDDSVHDENLKHIKDKIENALQSVETIKDLNPKVSWNPKNIFKGQSLENDNNEIILCVAIKMKKNDKKLMNEPIENGHNDDHINYRNGKEENQSISPELKFHSTNIFTKKREMLDYQTKSKAKDIDDDSPASYTVQSNDDDDDDNSMLSDTSLTEANKPVNETGAGGMFSQMKGFAEEEGANFTRKGENQIFCDSLNGNAGKMKNAAVLAGNINISAPAPLSAPNSPVKKAGRRKSRLQRSQSSEQTQSIGLNTREGSAYSRIRRLRSRHSQSLERVWLPGRSQSFNARVSTRLLRRDEVERETNSQYYILSPAKQEKCHAVQP